MNTNLDEVKLTAYALNELDETSRAAVEKLLATDPVARRWVEDVRRTAALLESELQAEECPSLTTEQTREIQRQIRAADRPGFWTRQWFPSLRLVEALAVVAIIAVLAALLLPSLAKTKSRAKHLMVMTEQRQAALENPAPEKPATAPPQFAPPVDALNAAGALTEPPMAALPAPVAVELKPSALSTPTLSSEGASTISPPAGTGQNVETQLRLGQVEKSWDDSIVAPVVAGRQTQTRVSSVTTVINDVTFQQGTSASTGGGNNQNNGAVIGTVNSFSDANSLLGHNNRRYYRQWNHPVNRGGEFNTEAYASLTDNPFLAALENPLSTFSIDVDTASYANVRRFLTENQLPPPDAVRIEEMINYFSYNYPQPKGSVPFSVNVEIAGCPWNEGHRLVRVGLKGREIARDKRPPSNLVFLIDVSGSMDEPNKLPLLKESLKLLTRQLNENDHVSIVVYAGAAGMVLPETSGSNKATILRALDRLQAGGSTHGSAGIQLAYETASENFIEGGVNRVILCTDGDFNVGVTSQGDLTRLIQEKAQSKIFLSVLGFGMGNYKDSTMEALADKGNGNYAYIDSLNEGRKVLVEQMSGTLVTIAKDVKIQIEFNPAQVNSYRLIGYENRLLAKEDFNNDKKDAGEIGAGHTVTALYEVVPAGMTPEETPGVDPLKYQRPARPPVVSDSDEMLTLKLRYKQPDGDTSRLLTTPVKDSDKSYARASTDFKFAAAVAEFGMLLRHSPYCGDATMDSAREHAKSGLGNDPEGYRAEFLTLVETASRLAGK